MFRLCHRRFTALSNHINLRSDAVYRQSRDVSAESLSKTLFETSPAAQTFLKAAQLESYWWSAAFPSDHGLLDDLLKAIRKREPDRVLEQLEVLQQENKSHIIHDLHLQAIVRALRPTKSMHPLQDYTLQDKISHRLYRRRMSCFRKWLKQCGVKISKEVYFILLEEGRIDKIHNGASQLVSKTWTTMLADGVHPDVYCYNSYIAASCIQSSALSHVRLRRTNDKAERRVARASQLQKAEGVLQQTLDLYRDMLHRQISPNTMTIELLMLALGWAGNLTAIKSIILQTWNVLIPEPEFHALEDQGVQDEYDEENIDLNDKVDGSVNTAKVAPGANLYPTQTTMFTIARIFGANQQNKTGLQAVELLAKVYKLDISTKVWSQLMKWSAYDAQRLSGFTPNEQVESIFQLAQDTYGTRPSVGMYSAMLDHTTHGRRVTPHTGTLLKSMITSKLRDSPADRPFYRYKERYPHMRRVAIRAVAQASKSHDIMQAKLQRKLAVARTHPGEDEIRLLTEDLTRRERDVDSLLTRGSELIQKLDNHILTTRQVQSTRVKARQGELSSGHGDSRARRSGDVADTPIATT